MREHRHTDLKRRNYRNTQRKKVTKHRNKDNRLYVPALVIIIIICFSILMLNKTESSASNAPHLEMRYKSIEIQQGDSLWSIASEHYTDEWKSVQNYMEEIQQYNGITNGVIHAGNYLSLPYIVEVQ